MNLNEALHQLATDGNLNVNELIAFAAEDTVGGRDTSFHRQPTDWAGMSTFSDEGKILYALIRALKPKQVVEIGVDSGGTSTHILTALEANGIGRLYSVDIKQDVGSDVPDHLRHRWTLVAGDGLTVDLPDHADFCFEDGDHHYKFTYTVLLRLKALNPRVILSHDYFTHEVYGGDFQVKQAFDDALPGGTGIKVDGAFTGLGVWWNKDWKPDQEIILSEPENGEPDLDDDVVVVRQVDEALSLEDDEPDVVSKPKAKPKKKAARRG